MYHVIKNLKPYLIHSPTFPHVKNLYNFVKDDQCSLAILLKFLGVVEQYRLAYDEFEDMTICVCVGWIH